MSGQLHGSEHATDLSAPYWDGLREGRLVIQRCNSCGRSQHYPRVRCIHCGSRDLDWAPVSGKGETFASTVMYRTTNPEFESLLPVPLALVRLEEGAMIMARLDAKPAVGAAVRFDPDATLATGLLTFVAD